MVKHLLKSVVQGAVGAVAPTLWRWRRPSLLVLMYHRVLPPDHPDRSNEQPGMYVSPQTLAMHLEILKENFSLLSLEEWLQRAQQGKSIPLHACAVTFDDGWRDNYDYAYPVLRRAQAPATIYLVSDLIGTRYSFWPNGLARLLTRLDENRRARMPGWLQQLVPNGRAALNAAQIDAVIMACKSTRSDAEMLAVVREVESGFPESTGSERDLMSWSEVDEMRASGLVRFGSHTRRHTRLSSVDSRAALEDEIVGSRRAIEERLGATPVTFCYPNGDTSPEAIACVRGAYRGAVTTASGWNGPGTDPFCLRRVGVHEDVSSSREAFLSRLVGIG